MENIKFFPMSEYPLADESDNSFSKTVLVYTEGFKSTELGYYDFETCRWSHFGDDSFLLQCWCYIPSPAADVREKNWKVITPKGYKKALYNS
jgi:hypothetical protein